jgi:hypothetical protein
MHLYILQVKRERTEREASCATQDVSNKQHTLIFKKKHTLQDVRLHLK